MTLGVEAMADATTSDSNIAAQRAQRIDAAKHLGTVLILVKPPPKQNRRRLRGSIQPRQDPHIGLRQFAGSTEVLKGPCFQKSTISREVVRMVVKEATIFEPLLQDYLGHGHGQLGIGGNARLEMAIAKGSRLAAHRVDQNDFPTLRTDLPQERHRMKVGRHRVSAPQQDQAAVGKIDRIVTVAYAEIQCLAGARCAATQRADRRSYASKQVPEAPA